MINLNITKILAIFKRILLANFPIVVSVAAQTAFDLSQNYPNPF